MYLEYNASGTAYTIARGTRDRVNVTRKGVIYCSGPTGTALTFLSPNSTVYPKAAAFAENGISFITCASDVLWGNDTHIARVATTYTNAQAKAGFDSSKVYLFATSGGAAPALNWARQNLAKVQAIALIIPAVDIIDIDVNNRVANVGLDPVTQGPRAGYGGLTPDTGHNPASNAAAFAGVPIKIWYGGADNVCLPSTQTAFQAAAGSSCQLVNMGAGVGHQDLVAPEDVLAFFKANP